MPAQQGQQILDNLAVRMKNGPKLNFPLSWVKKLVTAARTGKLNPSPGLDVAAGRVREEALEKLRVEPVKKDPVTMAKGKAVLEAMRRRRAISCEGGEGGG